MRILYIHTYYKYSGGEDVVYEKEKMLMQQQGCTVFSLEFNNNRFSAFKFLLAPFNPFSFFKTIRKINKLRPDVVHIHNWSFAASPSVIWAAKWKRVPVVHTLHNFRILCPSATLSYKQKLYLKSVNSIFPWDGIIKGVYKNSIISTLWMALISRFNYFIGTWKKVDRFIALTCSSKAIFQKSYLGINSARFIEKPNFVESRQYGKENRRLAHFLYIGRLSEEKGVHTLLSAFSDSDSSYKLRIIGDGPLRDCVMKLAESHSNISYLGFKDKKEVIQQLMDCTALIFPSTCFETFGMSIIEAFSVGTPIIGSNVGSPVDLIKDGFNGLHFQYGDSKDLIRKMHLWQMINTADKELFYINALQTYEEQFSPEKNAEQLFHHYHSVINAAEKN